MQKEKQQPDPVGTELQIRRQIYKNSPTRCALLR